MPISLDKINQARGAGYSDAEITDYLSSQGFGDKISEARNSGYSDSEIVSFLGERKPVNNNDVSKSESFITGASQGASFGFGDEIVDALSTPFIAGGAKIADKVGIDTKGLANKSMLDIYKMQQEKSNEDIDAAQEANPGTFIAGNLAGAVGTGIAGAGTKAGQALTNSLKSGNLSTRVAKGAAVGSASGALYGAGEAETGERVDTAQDAAKFGAVAGGALPVLGSALRKFKGKSTQGLSADDINSMAHDAYKKAADEGGILKSSFTDKFIEKVDDINPQTEAGKLLAGDNPVTKISKSLKELKGKNLSLDEAQEIDEFLGDAIDSLTDRGVTTKQSMKLSELQGNFRRLIDEATEQDVIGNKEGFEALKEGRRLWSRSSKLRDIEKIIIRAEMTNNEASALKTGFRNLYSNPSKMRGFTPEEKSLIKKAAETGVVGDLLGILGSRLNPIIAMGAGSGFTGTAAAQAASMSARDAATRLQLNRAAKLANAISKDVAKSGRGGAPRSVQPPKSYSALIPAISGVTAGSILDHYRPKY